MKFFRVNFQTSVDSPSRNLFTELAERDAVARAAAPAE